MTGTPQELLDDTTTIHDDAHEQQSIEQHLFRAVQGSNTLQHDTMVYTTPVPEHICGLCLCREIVGNEETCWKFTLLQVDRLLCNKYMQEVMTNDFESP